MSAGTDDAFCRGGGGGGSWNPFKDLLRRGLGSVQVSVFVLFIPDASGEAAETQEPAAGRPAPHPVPVPGGFVPAQPVQPPQPAARLPAHSVHAAQLQYVWGLRKSPESGHTPCKRFDFLSPAAGCTSLLIDDPPGTPPPMPPKKHPYEIDSLAGVQPSHSLMHI